MPFRDVVGHRALLVLLSRAIARDTLPQSLIFAGPDGVGKRLAAIAVAQAINCTQRVVTEEGTDGCGVCPVCRRIAQGIHPDVILLEGAGLGIDEIRAAIESSGYRPFEGRRRVFILDEADRLSAEIQNALLKTLEEPPPSSSFILVTSRPEVLLPTVRSRCPMLRFGRLSIADVERLLRERHGLEPAAAREAALVGEGSVGRAIVAASEEGAMMRQLVEQVLQDVQSSRSPADRLRAGGMLLEPGETRPRGRSKAMTKAASDRDLLGQRLGALGGVLRDLAALSTGAEASRLSSAPSAELHGMVKGFGRERLLAAFDAVRRAQEALDGNVNPKTIADWLSMQL
jgi:DNA polymerase III subunit delta'